MEKENDNKINSNDTGEIEFDVDSHIEKYLHHVETGINKALESVLLDIVQYKG